MEQNSNLNKMEHTLNISNRKEISISGITKVVSVKPDLVQLKTCQGDMMINGKDLEVTKLDLENHTLNLSGTFCGLKYLENAKTPLLKKIFK